MNSMATDLHANESDPYLLWAEICRLRDAVKGPDGHETWQDAAVAERVRRVRGDAEIARLTTSLAERENTMDRLETEVARLTAELEEARKDAAPSDEQIAIVLRGFKFSGPSNIWRGDAIRLVRACMAAADGSDTARLDHLQLSGSTVDLVPMAGEHPHGFRIGGLHRTVSHDIRRAIDAAMTKEKP